MNTQHAPVDDSGEGEKVEDLTAGLPDGGVAVFLLAFFVEAVDLGDLAGFVVAADECDLVRVPVEQCQYQIMDFGMSSGGNGETHFAFRHISNVNVSNEK